MLIVGSPSCVPESPALASADWPRVAVLFPGRPIPVLERAAQTVPGMPPRPPALQTQPVCAGKRFLLHTGRIQR
ncbi:hypothetical protein E2C01_012626 [Portunus trituberculatus]|uniref:Uncharacterized protein n=1 Tax=Portunus trituberculatus TaxID=210409 RepID=A0A5B7DE77_PORTR|nr:hypothetical protein [Portunus trituberculatus]